MDNTTYVPFDAGDPYDQRYRVQYLSPDTLAWANDRRFRSESDAITRMGFLACIDPKLNLRVVRLDVIDAIEGKE